MLSRIRTLLSLRVENQAEMKGSFAILTGLLAGGLACLTFASADAQALSQDVEAVLVPNVGAIFQTVELYNEYSSPVVACTYNLVSDTNPSATVRMRNVGPASFDIRLQQFENSNIVTAGDVHCLIVEEGVHTLSDGREIEAHTVLSDETSGLSVPNTWNLVNNERVDGLFGHNYTRLVMLGQVMTFNDSNASVFWTNNCSNRNTEPNTNNACVGKHIGQINGTRANETLGFIAVEAGAGTVNDVDYAFERGPDVVEGVGNSPPYNYTVSGDFDVGVLTQAAEDGGQGGWAVLYGNDPLPNNTIGVAIDEEVVAGDRSRTHIAEQVYYGVFENNQTPDVTVQKTAAIAPDSAVQYAIPGSDVIYTLSIENEGSAPLDDNTVFLVDTLPPETEFFNGDHNGAGSGVVGFSETDSGLTFTAGTDLRFSNVAAKPANFAACGYSPASGYDSAVRHVCFNPKGRARDGTLYPDSSFQFQFRVRIN